MTGGEIAAAGKAVQIVGKNVLGEDDKVKDALARGAEDTPEMRAAARTLAARVAVIERMKLNFLYPVARMFGVGREYFEDKFLEEMSAKVAGIPGGNIITPDPIIAMPTFQALSYSLEKSDLKEMYLNLLAAASDNRRADQAHPAFVEIIKQLAPEEAKILSSLLGFTAATVAQIRFRPGDSHGSYAILAPYLVNYTNDDGVTPEELPEQMSTWIDNWLRLRLINISYTEHMVAEHAYDWVQDRPEYIRLQQEHGADKIQITRGVIQQTALGGQFIQVVT